MTHLLGVEWMKLRTVRSTWIIAGVIVGLALLITLLYVGTSDLAPRGDDPERDVLRNAAGSGLLAYLVGVLCVAGEYRHGTFVVSLFAVPDRSRLMSAKVFTSLLCGLAVGLAAVTLAGGLGLAWLSTKDVEMPLSTGDVVAVFAGASISAGLWAMIGAGLGGLFGEPAPAMAAPLALVVVVEPILGVISGSVADLGPFAATGSLIGTGGSGDLSEVAGGLVLAGYAFACLALGSWMVGRRGMVP